MNNSQKSLSLHTTETKVCLGICKLEGDVCIGCDRTIEEIKRKGESQICTEETQ
jgi:predicted Fe-S protein YdhL (DUF1289 family)